MALRDLAFARLQLGEPLAAKTLIAKVLTLLTRHLDREPLDAIHFIESIATMALQLDDTAMARDILCCALNIHEQCYGRDSKEVGLALTTYVTILMQVPSIDEAFLREWTTRSIEIMSKFPTEHLGVRPSNGANKELMERRRG
jgi:hypothetical protein